MWVFGFSRIHLWRYRPVCELTDLPKFLKLLPPCHPPDSISYHRRWQSSRNEPNCGFQAYMLRQTRLCMHAYIHTRIRTYTHTYLHIYLNTYTHIHACTHTHTHTHIHTCMHTKTVSKIAKTYCHIDSKRDIIYHIEYNRPKPFFLFAQRKLLSHPLSDDSTVLFYTNHSEPPSATLPFATHF